MQQQQPPMDTRTVTPATPAATPTGRDIGTNTVSLTRKGIVRPNRPKRLHLQKTPLAVVVNTDSSLTAVPDMYTKTNNIVEHAGQQHPKCQHPVVVQTTFPWERCTVSVKSLNQIYAEEDVYGNGPRKQEIRDQVVIRFAARNQRNAFAKSIPNDMSVAEWTALYKFIPNIYRYLKAGQHFKQQLIPFRGQHVSSSQCMTHSGVVRQYVTINRHYQPACSDSWEFGRASVMLGLEDFKLLRKNADNIQLAVDTLEAQLEKQYNELVYASLVADTGFSSDEEDEGVLENFSDTTESATEEDDVEIESPTKDINNDDNNDDDGDGVLVMDIENGQETPQGQENKENSSPNVSDNAAALNSTRNVKIEETSDAKGDLGIASNTHSNNADNNSSAVPNDNLPNGDEKPIRVRDVLIKKGLLNRHPGTRTRARPY